MLLRLLRGLLGLTLRALGSQLGLPPVELGGRLIGAACAGAHSVVSAAFSAQSSSAFTGTKRLRPVLIQGSFGSM